MSKNEITILNSNESNNCINLGNVLSNRKGIFETGHDKLGRPFEKKLDDKGLYTKEEILKDGTPKLTIKQMKK